MQKQKSSENNAVDAASSPERGRTRYSRKRIVGIIAINVLILVIGVVAAELIFGGWLRPNHLRRLNVPNDTQVQFNVSQLYNSATGFITYSRDKYGLRGSHAEPTEIDILTIGGSTTDQRYIDDDETWQAAMEDSFAELGQTVHIANAGVDGQSTYGHIKNFEWWFPHIPGLEPSFIIFYIGLNDFHIKNDNRFDDLRGIDDEKSLKEIIIENSALYYLFRTIRGTWQAVVVHGIGHQRVEAGAMQKTSDPLHDDYEFMQGRLADYEKRLLALVDKSLKLGAVPVFVSQPSRRYEVTADGVIGWAITKEYEGRQINGVDYYHMMRRLDAVTERVAKESGAFYIDLAAQTGWEDDDFYDSAHMTPQGARKVGEAIFNALWPLWQTR